MTCVDCHDPHSQNYRDIYGNSLSGKFDNAQCLDCHPSKSASPKNHSNHAVDSPGNRCTSCHMPFLQHRVLGSMLRFARSDHTIPIPRPEFDANIGIENACSKCHSDKTVAWLQKKTTEWYGEIKPHHNSIKSLMAIHLSAGNRPNIRKYLSEQIDSLGSSSAAIQSRWSIGADFMGSAYAARGDYRKAIAAYKKAIEVKPSDSVTLSNLAAAYIKSDELETAIKIYERILEVDSDQHSVYTPLSLAYSTEGNPEKAIEVLKRGIKLTPQNEHLLNMLVQLESLESTVRN